MTSLVLRRIATPSAAERAALAAVVQASSAYYQLVEGRVPAPEAVLDALFAADPALLAAGRAKWVFGVWEGETCVGLIDALRGWKTADQCMLGLMLIAEPQQGRGIGRAAYALFEEEARRDGGLRSLRIGVSVDNHAALAFWRSRGFLPTGERARLPEVLSDVLLFEKAL